MQEAIRLSDAFLAASLCRLLTALLSHGIPQNISVERAESLARMHFVVATAWGLGGHLASALRSGLSKALFQNLCEICKQMQSLPLSVTIFDIMPDATTLNFKTFDTMVPKHAFESGVEFNQIFVPTAKSVAISFTICSIVEVSGNCLPRYICSHKGPPYC